MEIEVIEERINAAMRVDHLVVKPDGNHAHVLVVSAAFEGLNAVKKQQLVYGALNELIASGTIHAVHMQTYTPAEWATSQA